jgi:hypothetical protein
MLVTSPTHPSIHPLIHFIDQHHTHVHTCSHMYPPYIWRTCNDLVSLSLSLSLSLSVIIPSHRPSTQTHTHAHTCTSIYLSPGNDLVSAAERVPKEDRYTDWWDRNGDCQVFRDAWVGLGWDDMYGLACDGMGWVGMGWDGCGGRRGSASVGPPIYHP